MGLSVPSRSDIIHCEMCGRPVRRRDANIVYIEGARLVLCPQCYARVAKHAVKAEVKREVERLRGSARPPAQAPGRRQRGRVRRLGVRLDNYEVVDDYAQRVRRARERLGWTQRALAEAVRESENVIKRIEAGRLRPTIDLAMRLEKVLGVKLLEPIVDAESSLSSAAPKVPGPGELTLGDIVSIRKRREGK